MIQFVENIIKKLNTTCPVKSELSQKDIEIQQYIGLQFEKKGDKVSYCSLKKGEFSKIDMFALSKNNKIITLIKYKKEIEKFNYLDNLEAIYQNFDEFHEINLDDFTIRKVLYLTTPISDELKKVLIQIKDNIFKYKDLKIVILKKGQN